MCVCVCVCRLYIIFRPARSAVVQAHPACLNIYIHIQREREGEGERESSDLHALQWCRHTPHASIYVYIYRERERERERESLQTCTLCSGAGTPLKPAVCVCVCVGGCSVYCVVYICTFMLNVLICRCIFYTTHTHTHEYVICRDCKHP